MAAVSAHGFLDLRGQFTCRGDDQGTDNTRGIAACRLCRKQLKKRQGEARSLAGAGLGAGKYVAALQDERDRLRLYRGGLRVTLIDDSANQLGTQAKAFE